MNWSDYSRFVGDVFGARWPSRACSPSSSSRPSSGCGSSAGTSCRARCTRRCMWLVHLGTLLSAWFILAANSWMQHPVGYTLQPRDRPGRAHRLLGGDVQQGAAGDVPARRARGLHDRRRVRGSASRLALRPRAGTPTTARCTARRSGSAPWSRCVAGLGVAITGDVQGKIMTEVQPMKMAAAEALYETEEPRRRSRSSPSARLDGTEEKFAITGPVPAVLPGHRRTSTARSRASTSCARSTPRSTARTRARPTTPPATTCRSSR